MGVFRCAASCSDRRESRRTRENAGRRDLLWRAKLVAPDRIRNQPRARRRQTTSGIVAALRRLKSGTRVRHRVSIPEHNDPLHRRNRVGDRSLGSRRAVAPDPLQWRTLPGSVQCGIADRGAGNANTARIVVNTILRLTNQIGIATALAEPEQARSSYMGLPLSGADSIHLPVPL